MSRMRVSLITLGFAITGILVALLSAPVYKEERFLWREPNMTAGIMREDNVRTWPGSSGGKLSAEIRLKEGDAVIRLSNSREPLTIHSTIKGFGFPGAWRKWSAEDKPSSIYWEIIPTGTWSEFNGRVEASFSPARVSRLKISTSGGAVAVRLEGYTGVINLQNPGMIAGLPKEFTAKGPGKWFRPGRKGIPPAVIEVEADEVTVIP